MWQYQETNELYHHGVLGMRWGHRKAQNKNSSTSYKKKRKKPTESDLRKSVKGMSIEDLNKKTNRMNAENNYINSYKRLNGTRRTKKEVAKSIGKKIGTGIIIAGSMEVGKRLYSVGLQKVGKKTAKTVASTHVYRKGKAATLKAIRRISPILKRI